MVVGGGWFVDKAGIKVVEEWVSGFSKRKRETHGTVTITSNTALYGSEQTYQRNQRKVISMDLPGTVPEE